MGADLVYKNASRRDRRGKPPDSTATGAAAVALCATFEGRGASGCPRCAKAAAAGKTALDFSRAGCLTSPRFARVSYRRAQCSGSERYTAAGTPAAAAVCRLDQAPAAGETRLLSSPASTARAARRCKRVTLPSVLILAWPVPTLLRCTVWHPGDRCGDTAAWTGAADGGERAAARGRPHRGRHAPPCLPFHASPLCPCTHVPACSHQLQAVWAFSYRPAIRTLTQLT